jgi:hypothetical protein
VIEWLPIETAPKDRPVCVNDTVLTDQKWVASHWLDCDEWDGWVYEDDILTDVNPMGPEPTHWIDIPEPPK